MMIGQIVDVEINGASIGGHWIMIQFLVGLSTAITLVKLDTPGLMIHRDLAAQCSLSTQSIFTAISTYLGICSGLSKSWSCRWPGLIFLAFVIFEILHYNISKSHFQILSTLLPKWLKANWKGSLGMCLLLIYSVAAFSEAIQAWWLQGMLTKIKDIHSGGNSWGYGQTIVIVLWIPFLYYLLMESRSELHHIKSCGMNVNRISNIESLRC